jgi:hypothetical protein
MTTMIQLIEKVLLNVEGYNGDTDIYGTLNANITASATNFVVNGSTYADGSGFTSGLIEVGTELIYVQGINRSTGELQGVLRGFRGTTAQAWPAGTRVRNNPRYPISLVKDSINNTIQNLYPRLIAPKKIEVKGIASRVQYDMPNETLAVLAVQFLPSSATKAWVPVKMWKFDNFAGSNAAGTKSINIAAPANGRPIQIVYAAEPSILDYADDFTDSGLESWMEEVVILGSCWRLVNFVDASRIAQTTAEQSLINQSDNIRAGSATSLARYYYSVFEKQLAYAQMRQSKELPVTKHKTI